MGTGIMTALRAVTGRWAWRLWWPMAVALVLGFGGLAAQAITPSTVDGGDGTLASGVAIRAGCWAAWLSAVPLWLRGARQALADGHHRGTVYLVAAMSTLVGMFGSLHVLDLLQSRDGAPTALMALGGFLTTGLVTGLLVGMRWHWLLGLVAGALAVPLSSVLAGAVAEPWRGGRADVALGPLTAALALVPLWWVFRGQRG